MSASQSSLFDGLPEAAPESIHALNEELLRHAGSLASLKGLTFIMGAGEPGARIAIIGKSPGPPDVATGKPFSGRIGEIIDRVLWAIRVKRSECYLTNVVKFVPPTAGLSPEVTSFFAPYLHRELRAINPYIIIAMGSTAAQTLLGSKHSITQLRGQWNDYRGVRLMSTFNPGYILRDASKKREIWEDLKKVRTILKACEHLGAT